jgi:hypothetical protein
MSRAEVNGLEFAAADEPERAAVAPSICGSWPINIGNSGARGRL